MTSVRPDSYLLDTGCLIAAQEPTDAHHRSAAKLVELGAAGMARLLVCGTSYQYDLESNPSAERMAQRERWLREQTSIEQVAGPMTLDVSRLDLGDVLDSEEIGRRANTLNVLLGVATGTFRRRRAIDRHHMVAAMMASAVFVTTDHKDVLRRRDEIRIAVDLEVMNPSEAVQRIEERTTASGTTD